MFRGVTRPLRTFLVLFISPTLSYNSKVTVQKPPPIQIVTLRQLKRAVWPVIGTEKWAQQTLTDLWSQCTPVPTNGGVERRIIFPSKFLSWWAEVQAKMGIDAPAATILPRNGGGNVRMKG